MEAARRLIKHLWEDIDEMSCAICDQLDMGQKVSRESLDNLHQLVHLAEEMCDVVCDAHKYDGEDHWHKPELRAASTHAKDVKSSIAQ